MKKTILLGSLLLSFSNLALAQRVPSSCQKVAENFVEKNVSRGYDKGGFSAYQCVLAPNASAVICDVAASKGNGAAIDGYRVVMNKTCTQVFRFEMTSEE